MASKRPTSIKVEDETVKVEWDVKMTKTSSEGYPWGADYRNNRIQIAAKCRRSAARENLMHELLHKLWEKAGLDDRYAVTTEEYVITSLAGWLVDLLRSNPKLVEYLMEEDG